MSDPKKSKQQQVPPTDSVELTLESALLCTALVTLALGIFFWAPDAAMSFWIRKFFIAVSGTSSLIYVGLFHRDRITELFKHRLLVVTLLLSGLSLILTSSLDGLIGGPAMHPNVLSLVSGAAIGVMLLTLSAQKLVKSTYVVIVVWAAVNSLFWIFNFDSRFGFMGQQVILASYLLACGVLAGSWLYSQDQLPRRFMGLSLLFLSFCLLLTQTRSALLLLAIILLIAYRGLLRNHRSQIVVLGIAGLLVVYGLNFYFSRLTNVQYLHESYNYRFQLVQASLPRGGSEYILGGGINSIEDNIRNNAKDFPLIGPDVEAGIIFESSHNYFSDLLVERGLVVVLLYMVLLAQAIWYGLKAGRSQTQYLFGLLLTYSTGFIFVNNINIQIEVMMLALIMMIFLSKNKA